jgi:hypothetical protein
MIMAEETFGAKNLKNIFLSFLRAKKVFAINFAGRLKQSMSVSLWTALQQNSTELKPSN